MYFVSLSDWKFDLYIFVGANEIIWQYTKQL